MLEVNKNSIAFRLARHLCSSTPLVLVNKSVISCYKCYIYSIFHSFYHAPYLISSRARSAIQCTYKLLGGSTYRGHLIGGYGGSLTNISFGEGDMLYQMRLSTDGAYLNHLELYVNRSATYSEKLGRYGTPKSRSFNIVGAILGFYGYAEQDRNAPQPWCSSIGVYTL